MADYGKWKLTKEYYDSGQHRWEQSRIVPRAGGDEIIRSAVSISRLSHDNYMVELQRYKTRKIGLQGEEGLIKVMKDRKVYRKTPGGATSVALKYMRENPNG